VLRKIPDPAKGGRHGGPAARVRAAAPLAHGVASTVVRGGHVVAGIATEIGWIGAHLARYPLGLLTDTVGGNRDRHGLAKLSPLQRGLIEAGIDVAATPILLVHGIVDNHTIFSTLGRALRRRGFTSIWTFDYGLLTVDVRATARRLAEVVTQMMAQTGYQRVHIIGHSLGGLIARYYVQRLGGDAHVHTLVTLGTPHQGTQLARLAAVLPLVRQLQPESELVQELTEPAPGCRTRFIAFASDIDHLIVPSWRARLDHPDLHATNIAVHRIGHMSLTTNREVARQIVTALVEAGLDGVPRSTLRPDHEGPEAEDPEPE